MSADGRYAPVHAGPATSTGADRVDIRSATAPFTGRVLPVVFTAGVLLVLLPVAATGLIGGLIAMGIAVFLILLFSFGLAVTGSVLVVVGMFFGPLTSVVLPGASFVTVTDFLLAIGFLLLFPSIVAKPIWVPWQFVLGAMVFFTVSCLASLGVDHPLSSFSLMMRVMAATIILPLAFIWWAPRGRTLFWVAIAYPLGAAFDVIYALIDGPFTANGRYKGLAEQPTAFGYASLLGICLLPFLAARLPRGRRWTVLVIGTICSYGIWISGSRSSLLILIILAAMFPLLERSLKAAGLVAFGGVLTVAMFNRIVEQGDGSNALARLLGGGGARTSNENRIEGLAEAFDRFTLHPILGNGYEFDFFLAHNVYMQVATCAGIVGLVGFLFVLWSFIAPLFTGPTPYRLLSYPALAYVLVGPITPNLGSRYVGVMLALGLVAASFVRDDSDADETPRSAPTHAQLGVRPA